MEIPLPNVRFEIWPIHIVKHYSGKNQFVLVLDYEAIFGTGSTVNALLFPLYHVGLVAKAV